MTWRILQGNAIDVLRTLPAESVQTCVTSPPYWGLRSYVPDGHPLKRLELGLERTPDEYVERMVEAFREVRRVLRTDGTLWLNLGDCYATGAGKVGNCPGGGEQGARWAGDLGRLHDAKGREQSRGERTRGLRDGRHSGKHTAMTAMGPMLQPNRRPIPGLKPKDLVGIPWRVAFALQADGWYLRSDIVWAKPNPMPESVLDRPTKAHEYVFLLTKSERYFYDAMAIREPCVYGDVSGAGADHAPPGGGPPHRGLRNRAGNKRRVFAGAANGRMETHLGSGVPWEDDGSGRNRRSVWTIATRPLKEAHFAAFPSDLPEICIRAGTPEHGACAICGAPFTREFEVEPMVFKHSEREVTKHNQGLVTALHGALVKPAKRRTVGWAPSCNCDQGGKRPLPSTVLDPFAGAGTTGLVATRLGRSFIGIDLHADYVEMSRRRILGDAPLLNIEQPVETLTEAPR